MFKTQLQPQTAGFTAKILRKRKRKTNCATITSFPWSVLLSNIALTGLSLRAGGRGFSPATKGVAPGYFYWKIEEK